MHKVKATEVAAGAKETAVAAAKARGADRLLEWDAMVRRPSRYKERRRPKCRGRKCSVHNHSFSAHNHSFSGHSPILDGRWAEARAGEGLNSGRSRSLR